MYIEKPDLALLAGGFPPSLNTFTRQTELKPTETPDCYGLDLDYAGLKKGTLPTGSSKTHKSVTVGSSTFYWIYNRLWNINGNELLVGANDYADNVYVPQRNGKIVFSEDDNTIIGLYSSPPDTLHVLKQTGGYTLTNMSDTRALFQKSDIVPYMRVTSSANAAELDGILYVSNTYGLLATDGKDHVEISAPIKNNLSWVQDVAVSIDYQKKWVIAGNMVYDTVNKKLFRYNGTSFIYTTPKYHLRNFAPFVPERLSFIFDKTDDEDGYLNYAVKIEEEEWSNDFTVNFTYAPERSSVQNESLQNPRSTKVFQLKITDMSSNLIIKEIRFDRKTRGLDDYSA